MCDEIDSINTSNYRVYLAPHTQCNFELCASHLPIISLPLPLSFSSWHGIKIDSIFLPSFRPMISRLITSDAYLKSNLILSFPSQALFHLNNPSDSMTKSWKSFIQRNSSDLKALNRRLAVAILKRFLSTRADTLPRERRPPIVLTEKEEEEEESIGCRGSEEKRGKGEGINKAKQKSGGPRSTSYAGSLPSYILFPPLLSSLLVPFPSILSTPPKRPLYPRLHQLLSAGWLRMRERDRPKLMKVQGGDGPNPLNKPRLAKTINKRPACSRDKRDLSWLFARELLLSKYERHAAFIAS